MSANSYFSKNCLKKIIIILFVLIVILSPTFAALNRHEDILDGIDIKKGICVLLEDEICKLSLQLAKNTELLVYVQLSDSNRFNAACQAVDNAGLYGTRIWIEKGSPSKIHLADNLADLVIVADENTTCPDNELLRVLRPEGIALTANKKLTKPFHEGIDEWTHPYHLPDNNPQSKDLVSRSPYLTQFLAEPRYAPLPQVAVSSGGRLFKAFGHIAFKKREEPLLNTLVAFDAYNGTMLWKRPLVPGIMVHRNTIIATPKKLYLADDKSCKVIDTETGRLLEEIKPNESLEVGTFWKWMALQGDTLYVLIGEQEKIDPVVKQDRYGHGWPWDPLSEGFNQPENPWGYGRNLIAIDIKTKKTTWHHTESEPIDSRALCMKNNRIYIFRFSSYLACINAQTGKQLWRKTPDNYPQLFDLLGSDMNRQDWRTNWRTTNYLKCSDDALYFAGPSVRKLLAVSSDDGRILWTHPYDNYQLVIREDGLYGISGQIDKQPSRKFAHLTGDILAEFPIHRRACARVTASLDNVFFRASGGSVRLEQSTGSPLLISPMRAQCHDGVMIANGLLYWWPSVCDCNLTLYGITSLAPAGNFNFKQPADQSLQLEKNEEDKKEQDPLQISPSDWPTFRANNARNVTTNAAVPATVNQLWRYSPETTFTPTAPVTVEDTVYLAGSDGILRAFDTSTGSLLWKSYTSGTIRIPPTITENCALVGSGDGWVYNFQPRSGRLNWRFRAAPAERKIPVYNSLSSTWPVASGILVDNGIAYFAAGIVNYDGTYLYALDAVTGRIKWQNNTSGHLDPAARSGVSVQGHLLLNNDNLYLAGGNAVSPGVYNIKTGQCLNDPESLKSVSSLSPRGWELFLIGDKVFPAGKPFYADPRYPVFDDTVFNKMLFTSVDDYDITWSNDSEITCYPHIKTDRTRRVLAGWGKLSIPDVKPLWNYKCYNSIALAVCSNAVVVASSAEMLALNLPDGKVLWKQSLLAPPVPWGLAVGRDGRIFVTLQDGQILCFAKTD